MDTSLDFPIWLDWELKIDDWQTYRMDLDQRQNYMLYVQLYLDLPKTWEACACCLLRNIHRKRVKMWLTGWQHVGGH